MWKNKVRKWREIEKSFFEEAEILIADRIGSKFNKGEINFTTYLFACISENIAAFGWLVVLEKSINNVSS